jgi:hypothetical protein
MILLGEMRGQDSHMLLTKLSPMTSNSNRTAACDTDLEYNTWFVETDIRLSGHMRREQPEATGNKTEASLKD